MNLIDLRLECTRMAMKIVSHSEMEYHAYTNSYAGPTPVSQLANTSRNRVSNVQEIFRIAKELEKFVLEAEQDGLDRLSSLKSVTS